MVSQPSPPISSSSSPRWAATSIGWSRRSTTHRKRGALRSKALPAPVRREIEPGVAVTERHPDELALGVVHPGVVRTREPTGVATAVHGLGATVTAVVHEGVSDAVLVACQEY